MKCSVCEEELIYFPDGEWVCANNKCKMYAPNTYASLPNSTVNK